MIKGVPVMRFRHLVLLAATSVALLSTGCADMAQVAGNLLTSHSVQIPPNAELILEAKGEGYQEFQCSADKRGYFWRFVAPFAEIKVDGELYATQGADFAFVAPDGAHLKSKIVSVEKTSTNNRLKDILFSVMAHGAVTGELSDFSWIARVNASGGVPTEACGPENLAENVQIPFSATYYFYKKIEP